MVFVTVTFVINDVFNEIVIKYNLIRYPASKFLFNLVLHSRHLKDVLDFQSYRWSRMSFLLEHKIHKLKGKEKKSFTLYN